MRETISRPHPLSWAQHFVSGILHKRNGTVIELRETPVVEVPCTRGKPVHLFLFGSSLSLAHFHSEELSRKKEAICQLISTSQSSWHTATQCSNTEHTILIAGTTNHCPDIRSTSNSGHDYICDWNDVATQYHCIPSWNLDSFLALDWLCVCRVHGR